ncbi:CDP-glycerol glycerophosphotransferase family protein [Salinicoccus luteus]|uniref:CDP-glycerol glycerophosphotransferase family protein n=1 Tax=Salinicoccus luteus TaxID=367840 RepID=UPI0004E101C2|nr:CDP-glycerol glycerophosphotransferase family protein [Salinicoccus luteus]
MIREFAITVYLAVVRLIFTLCRVFPVRNKTVMLASFGDNIQEVIHEVNRRTDAHVIVLKEPSCRRTFEGVENENIIHFSPVHLPAFIRGLYHLATARVIFVDNYHLILAACNFSRRTTCVQLWHANGAVKLFGLRDKTIQGRPKSAHRRFRQVYDRFHKIVVSSDEMAEIFKQAFGLDDSNMLRTGVPRTDFFHSEERLGAARDRMHQELPEIGGKTVILYAPTFRDGGFTVHDLPIDIGMMEQALGETHHLLIHLHPAVDFEGNEATDFATDTTGRHDISALLSVTDILITDYSSIPFEFSTLCRPMIFYPYDLEEYESTRGLWFDYYKMAPGPVVQTTEALIRTIEEEPFDPEVIEAFDRTWNKYADGHAAKKLIDALYKNTLED